MQKGLGNSRPKSRWCLTYLLAVLTSSLRFPKILVRDVEVVSRQQCRHRHLHRCLPPRETLTAERTGGGGEGQGEGGQGQLGRRQLTQWQSLGRPATVAPGAAELLLRGHPEDVDFTAVIAAADAAVAAKKQAQTAAEEAARIAAEEAEQAFETHPGDPSHVG